MENKNISGKEVAIIGYWFATNYGGVASYYSLYKTVQELGYKPFFVENPYFKIDKEGEDVFSKNFFRNEGFEISQGYDNDNLYKLNNLSDIFLLGSDQVLTTSSIKAFGKLFLMSFAEDGKKRIAYASSCGGDNLTDNDSVAYAREQLLKFLAVSVREYSAVNLLWDKFGIRTETLIDPIFFTKAEEYIALGEKSGECTENEYFLSYVLDPTEDKRKCIEQITTHLSLAPKIILDGRKYTHNVNFEKINMPQAVLPELDLYQWLYYFSHASYIFTDSFHGAVMALIMNKPCVIYINRGRGYPRFATLSQMFDIGAKLIEKSSDLTPKIIEDMLDFSKINKKISEEVSKGKNWLNNSFKLNNKRSSIDYHLDLKNKCTGCGACYNACPVDAISLKPNNDGFLNPVIDRNKCIDCGLCVKKCVALHPLYTNNPDPECYAVMAEDNVREKSSSGGAFTVFANYILSKNGVICGAVFDSEFNVHHIAVTKTDELDLMRGSKYYQSNVEDIYKQVKQCLDKDKYVLFTGMPCQVAGLYSYLNKKYPKLYTVDILCHGISSRKVFEKYRKDVLGDRKLADLKFKAKKPWGWHAGVNATFSDGSTYSKIIEEDPYYIAYIQGLSKNKPCGTCPFNRLPRQGDMTFGDFWRIQDYKRELNDNKGTSVVLVNNEHGHELYIAASGKFPVNEKVPISYAIAGNGIIKYPYSLNINRDNFFKNLDEVDFVSLINSYRKQKPMDINSIPKNLREYYYIAEIIRQNIGSRKLVLWGENFEFRNFLSKYYAIKADFILTVNYASVNNKTIRYFDEIKDRASEYYVVVMGKPFTLSDYNKFSEYGFSPLKDFIYRMINPIVLENFDLSKGYSDSFGNRIEKSKGVVKRITFRGYNNTILIQSNVWNLKNLCIDLSANSTVTIDENTNFTQPDVLIETRGYDGIAKVKIGKACIFMDALFRLYLHRLESLVLINDHATFGEQISLRANQGKKIIIGKDCMFSSQIELLAGDGHTIMDVKYGKPINLFPEAGHYKNMIVLGEHTWIGYRSFIMAGTNIGDGSIVGAQSVVKGVFPNNCSIAGSPAKIIRTDIAWSRDMVTNDIKRCNGYANFTSKANAPISGQNVLVVGGTRSMGVFLVKRLLELGNNVTIATRGRTPDTFGTSVNRLILDVTNFDSVKKALQGQKFDYVFDNVAYSARNVKNLLSTVICKKYIQLSSTAVYNILKSELKESDFVNVGVDIDETLIVPNQNSQYYGKGERQAEAMALKLKSDSVFVRLPYVVKTDRLKYYVDCIASGVPMKISNIDANMSFVSAADVGEFLPWIAAQQYNGAINFAAAGSVTLKTIIAYIEKKLGKKAIIDNENGKQTPFNNSSFSVDIEKVIKLGFPVKSLNSWFWTVMDEYISNANLNK